MPGRARPGVASVCVGEVLDESLSKSLLIDALVSRVYVELGDDVPDEECLARLQEWLNPVLLRLGKRRVNLRAERAEWLDMLARFRERIKDGTADPWMHERVEVIDRGLAAQRPAPAPQPKP